AQAVAATAIFVLVKLLALGDLDHALRAAFFTPVQSPVADFGIARGGRPASLIDLHHVLPAGNAERAGNQPETVFSRVQGGALEAHVEAHAAAAHTLGIVLQPADALEPSVGVVIAVDVRHAQLIAKALVFGLAQLVFLHRMNVRIIEIHGRV